MKRSDTVAFSAPEDAPPEDPAGRVVWFSRRYSEQYASAERQMALNEGADLILVRDGEAIHAFERACPHEQADLSQGRVADGHPMHRYLVENGIAPAELALLERRPQPPDVMGWNYYPNSERWLKSDGEGHRKSFADIDHAGDRDGLDAGRLNHVVVPADED